MLEDPLCSKNVVINLSSFKYPSLSIRTNILRWADKQIFLPTVLWILQIAIQFLLFYSPQLQSQVWILKIWNWPIFAKSSLILFVAFRPFFFLSFFWPEKTADIFFMTPPLVSLQNEDFWTSAEIPYWWHVTYAQVWVVLLVPCEQRLHFRWVSCRAKSSLCWQLFYFLSCMREICHAIHKQN